MTLNGIVPHSLRLRRGSWSWHLHEKLFLDLCFNYFAATQIERRASELLICKVFNLVQWVTFTGAQQKWSSYVLKFATFCASQVEFHSNERLSAQVTHNCFWKGAEKKKSVRSRWVIYWHNFFCADMVGQLVLESRWKNIHFTVVLKKTIKQLVLERLIKRLRNNHSVLMLLN